MPLLAEAADSGISLNKTRVIFSAADRVQSLSVNNADQQSYLIQSRIRYPSEENTAIPFLITPPLISVAPGNKQVLRILKQDMPLPADRESLFYLTVLAIPAQKEDIVNALPQTRLSMGFQFVIKMFYRPQGVKKLQAENACQLRFSRTKTGFRVENSTPYYLTFGSLHINNQAVDLDKQPSMIAPVSTLNYVSHTPANIARWQILTDVGGVSAECQQPL